MILRRVIYHVRNQQWTAIAFDFMITVAGVFVGIQVSNWNSARIERRLEGEYIGRLQVDLDTIISRARDQQAFESVKVKQINIGLELSREPQSIVRNLRLGHVLTALTIRMSPRFESTTFNDLESSGRLSLISDAKLRNDLSGYFARLQYLKSALLRNNDNYVEPYVSYLREANIGAGYADPVTVRDVPMSPLDERLANYSRVRFGSRQADAGGGLERSPGDAGFDRLRTELGWRGHGTMANANLLDTIVEDSSKLKSEVGAQHAAP